ncbi:Deoxyribose-phosphate aldolase [Pseudobythopirellula maris]|uniref:Deoxyribose-phosphate aldolase n=1 Tax=Pseudobythopirellula maris TaxID=2527991 RepID=A0A5C5ZU64_9BACT|nr:deoxyribose-phosphate aldolase [Pseudobythopirellula maris]TWT90421.1 Deoxyribose-phosphate aldolase [Pseudobythopirellula maris]
MPDIVALIDHAVLHPTQTADDVRKACAMCAELGAASVCVKPSHVAVAAEALRGSKTVPSTVIGFPHGGTSTAAKAAETLQACDDGAVEVDMVVNIGQTLAGEWDAVAADIRAVVDAAKSKGAVTKVIFETGLLPDDATKVKLCELSEAAGAAYVKTSTGFGFVKADDGSLKSTGATEHDIALMRASCGPGVKVKASGGVRSYEDAVKLVALGAERLGTSGTEAIAAGQRGETAASSGSY